jgi:NAD+ synthase (glutamine-hydrolysing)
MKIALVQINPVIGDFKRQFQTIVAESEAAKSAGCELVIFPELSLCGYPPRDLLEQPDFIQANRNCLEQLVQTIRGIGVIVGMVETNPDEVGNFLYNSAVLFEDGRILQRIDKQLLPSYDVFDERRHFEPGPPNRPFTYHGQRIGLTICEDAWNDKDVFKRRRYAVDPVQQLVAEGVDLLINISASPFERNKSRFRDHMLSTAAGKYGVPLVFVNQVGGNDHILFDGSSTVFDRLGRVVARARDFTPDRIFFDAGTMKGDLHPVAEDADQAVLAALIMGTRDYVTKCGFSKAVVGLSGGIDSALVTCIAAQALGAHNVATVFMPSIYTARENYEDSERLARNLGVAYSVIPIDDMYERFTRQLVPGADPRQPGVTEQNVQARIRGTLLMGISNRDGCMVLSTGNKSELAVGYCTLYGDMNGGLAVISDVLKTQVYRLCAAINRTGEVIPQRIMEKAPTAELKPDQIDQDDLPPYEILDAILKGYVEELHSPAELIDAGFNAHTVADVIRRISQNEYKRHQAAPGLKISARAFGEGRRYPIAKNVNPV